MKSMQCTFGFIVLVAVVSTGCINTQGGGAGRGVTVVDGVPVPAGWTVEKRRAETVTDEGETVEKEMTYYTNRVGMEFVWVPPGEFDMGSPADEEDRDDDEKQHRVKLTKGFFMGATEVTNEQYRRLKRDHDSGEYDGKSLNGDEQPVAQVSWNDATAFCKWLTQQDGVTYGLPTEAQWEYACRAGSPGRYFWGESETQAGKHANVADRTAKREWSNWTIFDTEDGHAVSAPVGSYTANGFGLYDMLGNAWEWCQDWYDEDYYEEADKEDPKGPNSGVDRVLRGGSWLNYPGSCRSAARNGFNPTSAYGNFGFRIVYPPR